MGLGYILCGTIASIDFSYSLYHLLKLEFLKYHLHIR